MIAYSKRMIGFCVLLAILVVSAKWQTATAYGTAIAEMGDETTAVAQTSDLSTEIYERVEEQIRAFAKSINKSNADDSAATALAKHGLTGSGKKLSVGKTHALTATLWNSELLQVAAAENCAAAIEYMQTLDKDYLPYLNGFCTWNGSSGSYGAYVCLTGTHYDSSNREIRLSTVQYTGKRNAFDSALDWMAGVTGMRVSFQTRKVTADAITYSVTYSIWDRFDFDTSQGSGFDKLISGIGALLFREFDWESTVTFDLTVPYSCDHSTNNYHWTYDSKNRLLIPDGSDGYTENGVTRLTYEEYVGTNRPYYHKLDKPVRLYHDKPWIMEYTVRKPGNFVIAPLAQVTRLQLCLMNYANSGLLFQQKNIVNDHTTYNCYGTYYDGLLSTQITYTFRLENVIDAKGNNMV